ncbi:MAG: tetratricopeptide repeat protein [Syntrophobacteraceae bacterium]
MIKNKQVLLIFLFLTAITLTAFWQVHQCDFISYDDPIYVTENIHIIHGITIPAIRWALATSYASNWHPLTWMSHMLDVQLFGLNPRWHHQTNLLFHIANTLLLFFVFNRMTKAPWKSAFVAALFAIHPLHVESVAWMAERKDVLSTFFWMLTMAAYISYVEHGAEDDRRKAVFSPSPVPPLPPSVLRLPSSVLRYLAVLIFFALGLMAKPMLVTLPFVLLLLDYWPLQRLQAAGSREQGARSEKQDPKLGQGPLSANKRKLPKKPTDQVIAQSSALSPAASQKIGRELEAFYARSERSPRTRSAVRVQSFALRPLLLEKIPLFALAALSCIVTYVAQKEGGSVVSIEGIRPGVRIANAFISYIIYIGKTIWPNNLAVFYPHPGSLPLWQVFGAALLLIAVTFITIWEAERLPYLTVGWLWFTGTLVPVIGIVQVGAQAMADRYAYVPLIGLFIVAAWGIPELLKEWRYRKEALFVASALVLAYLLTVTWTQVGYWNNSISLYDHSLKVTGNNDTILNNRGVAYRQLGNLRHAISDYDLAIEINPKNVEIYNNLGIAHGKLGDHRQAIEDFDRAVGIDPGHVEAHFNRGIAYDKLGKLRQAIDDFDRVIEIDPEYVEAYFNRGVAYGKLGNQRRAIEDFDRVIGINPEDGRTYFNRAVAFGELGNRGQAIEDLKTAARLGSEEAKNFLLGEGINW